MEFAKDFQQRGLMTFNPEALARAVNARMQELGMSQTDLVKASGISAPSVRSVMTAAPREQGYRTSVRVGIARALGWLDSAFELVEAGSTGEDLILDEVPPRPGDDAYVSWRPEAGNPRGPHDEVSQIATVLDQITGEIWAISGSIGLLTELQLLNDDVNRRLSIIHHLLSARETLKEFDTEISETIAALRELGEDVVSGIE